MEWRRAQAWPQLLALGPAPGDQFGTPTRKSIFADNIIRVVYRTMILCVFNFLIFYEVFEN